MSNTCNSTIQIKRGDSKDIPVLKDGEFGFSEDTQELYIGQTNGENLKIFPALAPPFKEVVGEGYSNPEKDFTNKKLLLPIISSSLRSNASDYNDYFGLETVTKASAYPTISIKKSGFYMFQFGLTLELNKATGNIINAIGIDGIYSLSSFSRSFIKIIDPMDLETDGNSYYVQGTGAVYIDVDNSSFNGVPIFMSLNSGTSSQIDERVLATVKSLSFHLTLVQEGKTNFERIELK